MTSLTKELLCDRMHDRLGIQVKEASAVLEIFLELIKRELERGHEVKVSGFGKWDVKAKHARPGRNPRTGEVFEIPAHRVVRFVPSGLLREKMEKQETSLRRAG